MVVLIEMNVKHVGCTKNTFRNAEFRIVKCFLPLIYDFEKVVCLSCEHTIAGDQEESTPQVEGEIFDEEKLLYLH